MHTELDRSSACVELRCCSCRVQMEPLHRRANYGLWLGLARARSGGGRHAAAVEAYEAAEVLAADDEERRQTKIGAPHPLHTPS